jgi:ABC-2 type transport system ATP-binding protein
VIEVEGLRKRFGSVTAVDDLSFRAQPGKVTGFLGPNGAGKSTTLRSVLGLVHPDGGHARVLGRPYRELDSPPRRVGAILEASEIHPGRSGRNHLRVLATAARIPASRVEEVLRLVELEGAANRRAGGYSLGMRQRLGLATALLGDPEVLIADEPANGLDPQGIRWLRDFLRGLAAEGRTVLVSSHVLAEVAQTADEVVIINRGRLVLQGPMHEVLARATGGTRVRSPEAARLRGLLDAAGVPAQTAGDDALVVDGAPERVGEVAAANGVVLHELGVERATLEEVFLELTQSEEQPASTEAP